MKRSRYVRGDFEELDRFIERSRAALTIAYAGAAAEGHLESDVEAAYARSVRFCVRMLAVLVAGAQILPDRAPARFLRAAADAVSFATARLNTGSAKLFEEHCRLAYDESGFNIFEPNEEPIAPDLFADVARALLCPPEGLPMDPLFFQTVPFWWIGCAFEAMLAMRPSDEPGKLRLDQGRRKRRGVYFTPPSLVDYVIRCVLDPLVRDCTARLDCPKEVLDLRVLDPAMGGGAFLGRIVELLADTAGDRKKAEVAANCVYGIDLDPLAVEIARFAVWSTSGYADGISESIKSHLICGDALSDVFPLPLQEGIEARGFDAVVGNPPYIASKNRFKLGRKYGLGQSDSYLLFLNTVIERNLVRPGGMLSMVLPDPMLVRENAAQVRRKLAEEWSIESIVHIFGAFPDAVVANIIPVVRNSPSSSESFPVARIEKVADRQSFALDPCRFVREVARPLRRQTILAQERCEFLYLLEDGSFNEIIKRIHGPDMVLANYIPPFAPLGKLNVAAIYRGEEIGKSAITSKKGEFRMLLGGESVQPYEIVWEGRRIEKEFVRKPLDRYRRTKVLIQKSAARVIAAVDEVRRRHRGYVFPQSVYAVELKPGGVNHFYLLCVLNSQVINEYVHRTVTGYKMVHPQLEIEDIRALPIRQISFTTPKTLRRQEFARGIAIFEDECIQSAENTRFPALANFVGRCLSADPEMSDVVHDILVHLGRLATHLTRASRRSPDTTLTRRLECVRAAIETVVWQLYSTDPAQMTLMF